MGKVRNLSEAELIVVRDVCPERFGPKLHVSIYSTNILTVIRVFKNQIYALSQGGKCLTSILQAKTNILMYNKCGTP